MAYRFEVLPTAAASTNPLGITFGSTADIEVDLVPEKLINKSISNIDLDMVDSVGIYLSKGTFSALIPWSRVIVLSY